MIKKDKENEKSSIILFKRKFLWLINHQIKSIILAIMIKYYFTISLLKFKY
jgi:hypothetical protein